MTIDNSYMNKPLIVPKDLNVLQNQSARKAEPLVLAWSTQSCPGEQPTDTSQREHRGKDTFCPQDSWARCRLGRSIEKHHGWGGGVHTNRSLHKLKH